MADDLIQNARNLRKNATEAEKLLWSRLRNRQLSDLKFKRQHTFPPYILDFFCEQHKLGIELDGGQHNDPVWQMSDHQRTLFLEGKGITVLRFWNNDVLGNIEGVTEEIERVIADMPSPDLGKQRPALFRPSRGLDRPKSPSRMREGRF